MGDQGADFLRAVTLWSIRNVGWRPLSASVLSPKHATVAQWELSQVSVLEARLSMERVSFLAALSSLQHVTMLLPVLSLERWNDGVFSDPSVSRLRFASVLSPTRIVQP